MDDCEDIRLHDAIGFVGLRAHATAVGLLQLCTELVQAGVIDESAIGRIKDAIARDITLSRPRSAPREAYERTVRRRLDELFGAQETAGASAERERRPARLRATAA
jgi:hypothetical protein